MDKIGSHEIVEPGKKDSNFDPLTSPQTKQSEYHTNALISSTKIAGRNSGLSQEAVVDEVVGI